MLKTIGYSDRNTFHEYVQYMYENRKQQLVNAHGVTAYHGAVSLLLTMQSKKSHHCFSVFFFSFFSLVWKAIGYIDRNTFHDYRGLPSRKTITTLIANSRLHLLRKCAPLLSTHCQATIYKAFVHPILEYRPWCGWVHLLPLWVSWTLCNALHSISLAPSTACRAFHTVVMWQPSPTFFKPLCLLVTSPLHSVLPQPTLWMSQLPGHALAISNRIRISSVVKFTPNPVITFCEHSQQDQLHCGTTCP